jgi:hypothetical protein
VRFFPFDVNDETDAASIVFELGIVKSLLRRQSGKGHNLHLFCKRLNYTAIKLRPLKLSGRLLSSQSRKHSANEKLK